MQLEQDAVDFKEEQQRQAEIHRKAWEEDIKEKRRLEKMTEAKDRLAADIMTRRAAEFARLKVCIFSRKFCIKEKRQGLQSSDAIHRLTCQA